MYYLKDDETLVAKMNYKHTLWNKKFKRFVEGMELVKTLYLMRMGKKQMSLNNG